MRKARSSVDCQAGGMTNVMDAASRYLPLLRRFSLTQALRILLLSVSATFLRFLGFRVAIYPNDHRPAHVHVIGHGCEAVFHLNCPKGPVTLEELLVWTQRYRAHQSDFGHQAGVIVQGKGEDPWQDLMNSSSGLL